MLEIVINKRVRGFCVPMTWEQHDRVQAVLDDFRLNHRFYADDGAHTECFWLPNNADLNGDLEGRSLRLCLWADHPEASALVERVNAAVGEAVLALDGGRAERCVEFSCAAMPGIREALNQGLLRRWGNERVLNTATRLGSAHFDEFDGRCFWRVSLNDERVDECLEQLASTVADVAARAAAAGAPPLRALRDTEAALGDDQDLAEAWEAWEKADPRPGEPVADRHKGIGRP